MEFPGTITERIPEPHADPFMSFYVRHVIALCYLYVWRALFPGQTERAHQVSIRVYPCVALLACVRDGLVGVI